MWFFLLLLIKIQASVLNLKLGDEYPTHKCGYDSFSNAYNFISLKPGIYYLDVVYLKPISAGTIRYYPWPGLIKNSKFKYGAFEVKGGEILAVGLLEIDVNRISID